MTPAVAISSALLNSSSTITVEEHGSLARKLKLPVYQWFDPNSAPQAIVVGIHGVTLDGKCFDDVARFLASQGIVFVSFDMRGFGKWYHGIDPFEPDHTIDYDQTVVDLVSLLKELRRRYWHVPIFCAGECIGSSFCVQIAAEEPSLVDGLILSSPPVRRYSYLTKHTLPELGMSLITPNRQVDMEPFWRLFLSPDPNVVAERVNDPAGRRFLSLVDLLASNKVCRKTLAYARDIPKRMPVIILQGANDHMMKPEGAELLLSELQSTHKSIRRLSGHGHMLLETGCTSAEVKHSVLGWIKRRSKAYHSRSHTADFRAGAAS